MPLHPSPARTPLHNGKTRCGGWAAPLSGHRPRGQRHSRVRAGHSDRGRNRRRPRGYPRYGVSAWSDVGESRMKPEIFDAKEDVDRLIAEVQTAVGGIVGAVKGADNAAVTAAYRSVTVACNACHTRFRKPE